MATAARDSFISSSMCLGIWMSASSKCHRCQGLIIVNGFHLVPSPPTLAQQRAGPMLSVSTAFNTLPAFIKSKVKSYS